VRALRTQSLHLPGKVINDQLDAIPSAGPRDTPIGHRAPGRTRPCAEQEPERSAHDISKSGAGNGQAPLEAEMPRIKVDTCFDVIDQIANIRDFRVHLGFLVARKSLSVPLIFSLTGVRTTLETPNGSFD
jgi:hypothetical protein